MQVGGVVDGDEVVENGEVGGGGLALDPAQGIEVRGTHGGGDAGGEEIGGAGEGVGTICRFFTMVAGGALEDGAGVEVLLHETLNLKLQTPRKTDSGFLCSGRKDF